MLRRSHQEDVAKKEVVWRNALFAHYVRESNGSFARTRRHGVVAPRIAAYHVASIYSAAGHTTTVPRNGTQTSSEHKRARQCFQRRRICNGVLLSRAVRAGKSPEQRAVLPGGQRYPSRPNRQRPETCRKINDQVWSSAATAAEKVGHMATREPGRNIPPVQRYYRC